MPVQSLSFGSRHFIPTQDLPKSSTYFSKSEIQYSPLIENGDIETEGFIRGCNGIVEFVGFLGSTFSPVKNDISGNLAKLERTYHTDPQRYATVRKLLDAEIVDWPGRMGPATEGLLYLKRGLEFISTFLELIVLDYKSGKKSNSLVPMGKEAYDRTLKRHHKKIERGLFKIVIHATPHRKELLKTIAAGRPNAEDECVADIAQYLVLMKANVGQIVEMYKEFGFEK